MLPGGFFPREKRGDIKQKSGGIIASLQSYRLEKSDKAFMENFVLKRESISSDFQLSRKK